MVYYLTSGLTLGLFAASTPGPFQAFLLNQAANLGWKKTLPTALAPLISDGPIILLILFLLSQTPDWFLNGLVLAGGIFILYLGIGALKDYREFNARDTGELQHNHSVSRQMAQAVLMNVLSPGPWLFWSLSAGPIFLAGWREAPLNGISFMAGFYGTLVGGNLLFITLFASARLFGRRLNRGLIGFSGLTLVIFGLFQLYRGILSFI